MFRGYFVSAALGAAIACSSSVAFSQFGGVQVQVGGYGTGVRVGNFGYGNGFYGGNGYGNSYYGDYRNNGYGSQFNNYSNGYYGNGYAYNSYPSPGRLYAATRSYSYPVRTIAVRRYRFR